MNCQEIDWIVELINWAKKYKIKNILEISNNNSNKDTEEALLELSSLYLCNKNIYTLPDAIINLQNLKCLYLSDNEITVFPTVIFEFEKLELLDIANNMLTEIPFEITSLKSLKYLNIFGNKITYLPKFIKFNQLHDFACNGSDILIDVE